MKWIFNVLGWGVWTATKWYGTPGGNGVPRVRADAFTIGGDTPLGPETPIDGAASTFPANAWPFNNDDHLISTANGPVTVAAKDPFKSYNFAGWLQLIWGGDDTGEFVETDAGTNGSLGGSGFFDHLPGSTFSAAQGSSADLLATYGYYNRGGGGPYPIPDWLRELVDFGRRPDVKIPLEGDPAPWDLIRLKVLEQLIQQTQPSGAGGTDFNRLIERAPNMSREELQRAVQSINTTLDLGKAALSAMEAQLKGKPK